MDQPAGLQVDYVFRGVEHAVRVVVSGQVLELEVEDRMTADQWRGEFDASCECASLGWVHLSFPRITFFLKMSPTRNLPICLFYLTRDSKVGRAVWRAHPSGQRHWNWGKLKSLDGSSWAGKR